MYASRACLFGPSPSSGAKEVPTRKASIAASCMFFFLSFIAALMIGPYTTFPSFPCVTASTDPRIDPEYWY